MTTSNLNVAHSSDGVSSPDQLSLPVGPVGLVRPRHARTDGDRDFMARAFSVRAGGLAATAVYRCLAYHCSKSERRIAYPAQATVAEYCEIGVRHVRRVLRKLEVDGLIVCEIRKKGAHPSHYSLADETRSGSHGRLEAALMAANKEKEGIKIKQKALSLNDTAQTIDPSEDKELNPHLFPSLSQEQEKASAPVTENRHEIQTKARKGAERRLGEMLVDTPRRTEGDLGSRKEPRSSAPPPAPIVFAFPKIVALWFALMRKLNLPCDDTMACHLDRLPHPEKKRVIDDLEAQECALAHQGRVSAPPIKKPKGFLTAAAQEAQRIAACQHVPAEDLPINCGKCGAYIGKE